MKEERPTLDYEPRRKPAPHSPKLVAALTSAVTALALLNTAWMLIAWVIMGPLATPDVGRLATFGVLVSSFAAIVIDLVVLVRFGRPKRSHFAMLNSLMFCFAVLTLS